MKALRILSALLIISLFPAGLASQNAANAELVVAISVFGPIPYNIKTAESELSRLCKDRIGKTIKLLPIDVAAYDQQITLMLAAGERIDLMMTGSYFGMGTKALRGQLTPLDDLVAKYGQGIQSAYDKQILSAGMVDGKLFAVPPMKTFGSSGGFFMRKDLIDKYGINYKSIKSLDDIDRVLRIIKKGEPGVTPMGVYNNTPMSFLQTWDNLGDSLGVLMNYGQDAKVVNLFATSEYKAMVKKIREMYKAGLIQSDAATTKEMPDSLMKAGKIFSYLYINGPGYAQNYGKSQAHELVSVDITKPLASTAGVMGMGTAIPFTASDPVKSMQFLNLLFSDPAVYNAWNHGLEGSDYVKKEGGLVDYAPGTKGKANMSDLAFQMGNLYLMYPWVDNPRNIEDTKAYNATIVKSKALGFILNPENVKNELTACSNVMRQYGPPLECGAVDPDTVLPKFLEKLAKSGIDKIIAEKQRQLDAWTRENRAR